MLPNPNLKKCTLCSDCLCIRQGYLMNKSKKATHNTQWYPSMHADNRVTSELTLPIQRLPSHVCFHTFFFLSNLIFYRAHSSTFTIGRADSAEGHPDTWAEWMTFRVQFPIFHHFLWKVLLFMYALCNHPHTHTHTHTHPCLCTWPCSRLLAATELFVFHCNELYKQ